MTKRFTAETYTIFNKNNGESGWCVKLGDDTVCDLAFGCGWPDAVVEHRAHIIAGALNDSELTP